MVTDDRPRFRHFFRCRACANRFYVDRLTADSAKVKTPRCPRKACGGKARESHVPDIGLDVAAGRAPPKVGHVQVRAFDQALQITAEDHQMGDLRDHARPGENSVPPLRPDLQRQADAFWGAGQKRQDGAKRGKVDMSPIFGERAQQGQPAGARFTAGQGTAIAPILQSKDPGTSPVPAHRIIAG